MPEESYLYALPYNLYKEHGIRRYGAHGTSHFYVTQEAAKMLNKPVEELNIITCHLGNGGSVSAIRNGKCVDTSMGLTPLEGLVMGTRSGDIDPAIIFHLHDTLGMSVDAINKLLTKESGLLGLTEVTSDCRYVEDNYATKEDAKRAMDVYCHRLAKYIGAYTALMDGRLDVLYSLVVSVKMPRWFVNCLWANWACWALKLIMNATWLHVSANLVSSTKKVPVLRWLSQPTKNWLSRKTRAA